MQGLFIILMDDFAIKTRIDRIYAVNSTSFLVGLICLIILLSLVCTLNWQYAGNVLVYGAVSPCDMDWFGGINASNAGAFFEALVNAEVS